MKRGWEIAAHGNAVTQVISSRLAEADERAQIAAALGAIEHATGTRPAGWHGPEYGESARTPGILASLGVKYLLDWPNDELPYAMTTASGTLVSVPMLVDFDDVFAHWYRKLTMARWQRSIADALDQLLEDGRTRPRMLILNLHPWLIGQPWRISYLDAVLADLRRREGIWLASAGEIAAAVNTSA
jgi:peptidoglycan/xylan/chitin deacetylase (PgdA/CDA1 family)